MAKVKNTRKVVVGDTVGAVIKGHLHLYQVRSLYLAKNTNTGAIEPKCRAFALGHERREHNVSISLKDLATRKYRLLARGRGPVILDGEEE